jgi:hypothetical protein
MRIERWFLRRPAVAKSTRLADLVSYEPFKYVLNMNTNFNEQLNLTPVIAGNILD